MYHIELYKLDDDRTTKFTKFINPNQQPDITQRIKDFPKGYIVTADEDVPVDFIEWFPITEDLVKHINSGIKTNNKDLDLDLDVKDRPMTILINRFGQDDALFDSVSTIMLELGRNCEAFYAYAYNKDDEILLEGWGFAKVLTTGDGNQLYKK